MICPRLQNGPCFVIDAIQRGVSVRFMLIILAAIIMGKVASMEGRSSIGWGITALLICAFIPIPLFGILLGMAMTYALMFAMNLMQK